MKVVAPGQTPKRGKGGSAASRIALLHSLCHIENWAVDLSWDVIARFGSRADYELPKEFFDDFVTVSPPVFAISILPAVPSAIIMRHSKQNLKPRTVQHKPRTVQHTLCDHKSLLTHHSATYIR